MANGALSPIPQTMEPPNQRRSHGTEHEARAISAFTQAIGVTETASGTRVRDAPSGELLASKPQGSAPAHRTAELHLLRVVEPRNGGSFGSKRGSTVELKRLRSPPN